MKWPARAAIRPVPPHAVVPPRAIAEVESLFGTTTAELETRVDRAFCALDERQPAIAKFIAREVGRVDDDVAQALGHFLVVSVHEAFARAFGARLLRVDDEMLELARASFEIDETLRRGAPGDALESDDVVAIAQPHMVTFVREQVDAALLGEEEDADVSGDEDDDDEVDLEAVSSVYRAVLVTISALSNAVQPPTGIGRTVFLA